MDPSGRGSVAAVIGCHRCDAEAGLRIGHEFLCGSCAVEDLRSDAEPPIVLCDLCEGESTLRFDERFLCGRCALALLCEEARGVPDVLPRFASALDSAIAGEQESVVAWAWQLARMTREGKLSVADISATYHQALIGALAGDEDGGSARLLEAASGLFAAYAASLDARLAELTGEASGLRSGADGLKRYAEQLRDERDEAVMRLRRESRARGAVVRQLTKAKEEERDRIAEEMHDDTVQTMVAVQMRLHGLRLTETAAERHGSLEDLERVTTSAIGRLRRLMFELRSDLLEQYGLERTLREYLRRTGEHFGLEFRLDDRLGYEPVADVRVNVYRIAQEAIANVRKHARATRVSVTLDERDGGILVTVRDDGRGFDPVGTPIDPEHLGLRAMRERAEGAGGWFGVASELEAGTEVTYWIPNRIGSSSLGAA